MAFKRRYYRQTPLSRHYRYRRLSRQEDLAVTRYVKRTFRTKTNDTDLSSGQGGETLANANIHRKLKSMLWKDQ